MALPVSYANLPGPGPPLHWGYNIVKAHEVICQHYTQALHVLRREDEDPFRLRYHIQRLKGRVVPLLRSIKKKTTWCLDKQLCTLSWTAIA